jgi:hypothetical protein
MNVMEEYAAKQAYKKYIDEVKIITAEQTCELITIVCLKACAEHFGFGSERLNRVVSGIRQQLKEIDKGTVSIIGLRKWLESKEVDIR